MPAFSSAWTWATDSANPPGVPDLHAELHATPSATRPSGHRAAHGPASRCPLRSRSTPGSGSRRTRSPGSPSPGPRRHPRQVRRRHHLLVAAQLVTLALLGHRRHRTRRATALPASPGSGRRRVPERPAAVPHQGQVRGPRSGVVGLGGGDRIRSGSRPRNRATRRPSSQRDRRSAPGRCHTPDRSDRSRAASAHSSAARSSARIGLAELVAEQVHAPAARRAPPPVRRCPGPVGPGGPPARSG